MQTHSPAENCCPYTNIHRMTLCIFSIIIMAVDSDAVTNFITVSTCNWTTSEDNEFSQLQRCLKVNLYNDCDLRRESNAKWNVNANAKNLIIIKFNPHTARLARYNEIKIKTFHFMFVCFFFVVFQIPISHTMFSPDLPSIATLRFTVASCSCRK